MSARSPRLRDIRANGFPLLNEYWNERDTRKRDAKAAAHQRALTARYDAGMAPHNQRQAQAWADNGEV